jgi:hypothetical protein
MNYGYHYTPCSSACSGPAPWVALKLAAIAGAVLGIGWVLRAIGRAIASAASAVSGAAAAAGPIVLVLAGLVVAGFVAAVVMFVVRNNQRPPLVPHDRPERTDRRMLEGSTVEVIEVIPNRPRLNAPRPAFQPFASRTHANALR